MNHRSKKELNQDSLIEKNCKVCGRIIEPRKKWMKNWNEVQYCSDSCRKQRVSYLQRAKDEEAILELLSKRSMSASICPSEILSPAKKKDPVRMEEVRQAARRLVHKQKIEITQKGQVVDPSNFRGPIRLRRKI